MTTALSHLCDKPHEYTTAWPDTPRIYQGHDLHVLFDPKDAARICQDRSMWPRQISMVRHSTISGERPVADHPTDTLVLNGMHLSWPSLNRFCMRLEGELGHPMTANIYATPPDEQGFNAHWDTHHVWIAQVAGMKRWRVSAPVFANPLEHHTWKSVGFTGEQLAHAVDAPEFTFELTAGQVLWIPKGWVHWGATEDESSMHITIGVHTLTWHWAVRKLLALLAETDPGFREVLPPRLDIHTWEALVRVTAGKGVDVLAGADAAAFTTAMRSAQHQLLGSPLR
jgi:hypothetical protein